MHAIPTTYGGVNFRSRLEARWAAFFDLLGWSWEYEPIDLAGYIPDFILGGRVLVEVKPMLWPQPRDPDEVRTADEVADKIDASGWRGTSILLGTRMITRFGVDDVIGLVRDTSEAVPDRWEASAWVGHKYELDYPAGKVTSSRSFSDRGGVHENVMKAWREAGNRVQWKRPA